MNNQQYPGYGGSTYTYPHNSSVPPQPGFDNQNYGGGYQQGPPAAGSYPPPQGPPMTKDGYQSNQPPVQPSAPALPTQYKGEVPLDDVDENDEANAPTDAPPSYDFVVSGYENTGGNEAPVGPPPPFEEMHLDPAVIDSSNMKQLTHEDAREALLQKVKQNCCWGAGAAKNMTIQNVASSSAYHYIMESYLESRSTKYAQMPFRGEFVDGPHMGIAPGPWNIVCNPQKLFYDETQILEVPHTSVVKQCNICYGSGITRCWKCKGRGKVRCASCHGSGRRTVYRDGEHHHDRCSFCHGNGRKRCQKCQGCGCLTCYECQGFRQVRQFIRLTVKYENKTTEHVIERTDLPNELIKGVLGDEIFTQTAPRVRPIERFFDEEINQKSAQLVTRHNSSWPAHRIIQQRQTLRSVPVYECSFNHGGEPGRFWVYGHQSEVYTQDYPHTCCCCSIL